jgi:hypothetical protein
VALLAIRWSSHPFQVGQERAVLLRDDNPKEVGLLHRLRQFPEVNLPGVVALPERFQAALDEGCPLAELELLPL